MAEQIRRCFVISPIGSEDSNERKHADILLNLVIREVLEDKDVGYTVVRSDQVNDPGMITSRIIQDILNSALAVADLTFLNANVLYELGIRHMTGKPTIHFASTGTKLPFDNADHRAIIEDITTWQGVVSARQKLKSAAMAIDASGYRVSNPITQANALFNMLQDADPRDELLLELRDRVARLEAREQEMELVAKSDHAVINYLLENR